MGVLRQTTVIIMIYVPFSLKETDDNIMTTLWCIVKLQLNLHVCWLDSYVYEGNPIKASISPDKNPLNMTPNFRISDSPTSWKK